MKTPVEASLALPATILGGGLVLSGLVALLLVGLGRRERYAQNLSDRRLAERERAEGARRAAEERFRRAFEGSGVGMALVGVSGPGPGIGCWRSTTRCASSRDTRANGCSRWISRA